MYHEGGIGSKLFAMDISLVEETGNGCVKCAQNNVRLVELIAFLDGYVIFSKNIDMQRGFVET